MTRAIHVRARPDNRYHAAGKLEALPYARGMQRRSLALAFGALLLVGSGYALFRATETAPGEQHAAELHWVSFIGACDASGAVPIDERHFAVADDEDNVIRVYDAVAGGKPVSRTNLSKQIALAKKGEADIEAATALNGRAYWLSSHARNAKGDLDPNRSLLITTDLPALDARLEVQGQVYRHLLDDLEQSPALSRYDLARAAALPPKAPGGLNLEGLTATPEGTLLIGFRSPIPGGQALLVPLLNPEAAVGDGPLRFGEPIELDLGGLGVRSLSYWRGRYLIAAGPAGGDGPHRLYGWQGPGTRAELLAEQAFANASPEAFFTPESNAEILVLSDDGNRVLRGKPCKKTHKRHRRFRGVWLRLPAADAQ
ncbi:MAG TPA: DUF3616 domain-containing protein [Polyangiaceae bacterium]|nr:DUF3616 domain-containing protein [Polyangiaceae bacterium]